MTQYDFIARHGPLGYAAFSPCMRYRYLLHYYLEPPRLKQTTLTFLMMNPSTADEDKPDPTVTRCMGFARRWGYSALTVLNAFAIRETDSKELTKYHDPIGPLNGEFIRGHASDRVIVAWGKPPLPMGQRSRELVQLLGDRKLECLAVNKDGSPKHPLYLRGDTVPVPWVMPC